MNVEKCYSASVSGVSARLVEVEVSISQAKDICGGGFSVVGLPDQSVRESRDRVMSALAGIGAKAVPRGAYVTVNLAPANVRKEGPGFDLPIAVAILAAMGVIGERGAGRGERDLKDWGFAGELALSGEVRRVKGILPIVLEMQRRGKKAVAVPAANAREAGVVDGIAVYGVHTLMELVDFLAGRVELESVRTDLAGMLAAGRDLADDFSDVKGQAAAKRAIEVAVAGGHNILMIGSPGSGKTMLARRIPSILPPLTMEEALDVTRIHSVAGLLKGDSPLVTSRPFRAPHHTVSDAGLLGGGANPAPGEVSLAHRGVLFLDEFPEFKRNVLEVLRQPLEDGRVTISRAAATCDFPSRFMLVAAMNPCPCGYSGDPRRSCRCSSLAVERYRNRISGPLLDRIDIQIEVAPVPVADLTALPNGEPSAAIRERIVAARERQHARFADMPGVLCNAEIPSRALADVCRLDSRAQEELKNTLAALDLSARAYTRVLKVARTIADLAGRDAVDQSDIFEATRYRAMDQTYFR